MKRLFLFSAFLLILFSPVLADELYEVNYNVIPLPKEVKLDPSKKVFFMLKEGMSISYDANNAECSRIAQFLKDWTKEATGLSLQLTPDDKNAQIKLRLVSPAAPKGKKSKK